MESSAIMIIIVVVIGVIIAVVALGSLGHSPNSATTTVTQLNGSAASTTSVHAIVSFYNVDVKYVYTGPASKNGVNCSYNSYAYIDGQSQTINSSSVFYLQFQESSDQCAEQVYNVTVNTPGFALMSTVPQLPINLPPNSQVKLQLDMRASPQAFYGPLSVTIYFK